MKVTLQIELTDSDISEGMSPDRAITDLARRIGDEQQITVQQDSQQLERQMADSTAQGSGSGPVGDTLPDDTDGEPEDYAADTGDLDLTQVDPSYLPAGVKLDETGAPWVAEVHNSNGKMYQPGSKDAGKWMWRRGINREEAQAVVEQAKQELIGQVQRAMAAGSSTQHQPDPTPEEQPAPTQQQPDPTPEEQPAPTQQQPDPEQDGNVNVAALGGNQQQAPAGEPRPPQNWDEFLKAMSAKGLDAAAVQPAIARQGLNAVTDLARPENSVALMTVASELQMLYTPPQS